MSADLTLTTHGGIARLTFTRSQKRNALNREMLTDARDQLRNLKRSGKSRLFQVVAEGPVFCAGMDLTQMQETAANPRASELWRQDAQLYRELLKELTTFICPSLAIVQGPVVAGGVGIVLGCDMVLAADEATFSLPEPQRGITASLVTPLLAYRLGAGRAAYMLLSGQSIDAKTALSWGLVHEVVPQSQLAARANELSESILGGSPSALAATKQHLTTCTAPMLQMQLDLSVSASAASRETPDAREGLDAFLEHRLPFWHPRAKLPPQ